jgi:hypothetical protein
VNETEEIAYRIHKSIPNVKKGSLRFYGEWFGRPHDNTHTLVRGEVENDRLRLFFDQGEILSIWFPRGLSIDKSTFKIKTATRVRWEWYYYGRSQVSSNLYFMEFERSGLGITASSNIDSYQPSLNPTIFHPAVEIL